MYIYTQRISVPKVGSHLNVYSVNYSFFSYKLIQNFNLTGITKSGWKLEDVVVEDLEQLPDPRPPTYRKKDIVSDVKEFNLFDKHAVKV